MQGAEIGKAGSLMSHPSRQRTAPSFSFMSSCLRGENHPERRFLIFKSRNRGIFPPVMRALLLVLDSVGCGPAPDSATYGDEGANTLGHIFAAQPGLQLPALFSLGLWKI